jgi:hypothetical protein
VGKRTNTRVGLTEKGRAATQEHWKSLESLQQSAEDAVNDEH